MVLLVLLVESFILHKCGKNRKFVFYYCTEIHAIFF